MQSPQSDPLDRATLLRSVIAEAVRSGRYFPLHDHPHLEGDDAPMPITRSIGFHTNLAHPDILIPMLSYGRAQHFLAQMYTLILLEDARFDDPRQIYTLDEGGYGCRFLPLHPEWKRRLLLTHTAIGGWADGADVPMLQMVFPTRDHEWPWAGEYAAKKVGAVNLTTAPDGRIWRWQTPEGQ